MTLSTASPAQPPTMAEKALQEVLGRPCRTRRDGLTWTISRGGRRLTIRMVRDWVVIDRRVAIRPRSPIAALRRSTVLAGGAKYVRRGGRWLLRAEVPLRNMPVANGEGVGSTVAHAVASVVAPPGALDAPAKDGPAPDVEALCRASGHEVTLRATGQGTVPLDASRTTLPATVVTNNGRVRLTATLVPDLSPRREARAHAAASVLAAVSGSVRMVRAVASRVEGVLTGGLEVVLSPNPSPVEFGHALSAMATALDTCAPEIDLLDSNAALAASYLAITHNHGTPAHVADESAPSPETDLNHVTRNRSAKEAS